MFESLTAVVLRIQVFQYAVVPCHWDCLTLKTKALQYLEMSGTTHPMTQCQSEKTWIIRMLSCPSVQAPRQHTKNGEQSVTLHISNPSEHTITLCTILNIHKLRLFIWFMHYEVGNEVLNTYTNFILQFVVKNRVNRWSLLYTWLLYHQSDPRKEW